MELSEFVWFTGLFFALIALIIDSDFVAIVAILMLFYALLEHITEKREIKRHPTKLNTEEEKNKGAYFTPKTNKMKTTTYTSQDGTKRVVEYDEQHPCLICGEPVHNASMGGTVICPSCDLGKCRFCGISIFVFKEEIDGGRSKREVLNHMKYHRKEFGLKPNYTEEEFIKRERKDDRKNT